MLNTLSDRLLVALAWVGGAAIVLLALHVGFGVILRYFLHIDVPMTFEIVTKYYMVALAFVPIAWVERQGGMVSVEIIDLFVGKAGVALMRRFADLVTSLVYLVLTVVTWRAALSAFDSGTYVLIKEFYLALWPGYFLLPIGFAVATLVTTLRLFAPEEKAAS